ncbi:transposase, partial [Brevibacterium daeguense]|uniref:transposase n=1 Tax=Brevibacterium daeguense TaxID=909936 RepID=UPI0030192B17
MSHSTGFYPSNQVDDAGAGIVSQAGAVVLLETIKAVGLDRALRDGLSPWRRPLAVHDPAKVVLDLAVALAAGGDCLADVDRLRDQPGVFGKVASDATVSRLIAALAADKTQALAVINQVRAEARA